MMKALSLSQPWCWSLFDPLADKGVENRSWPPPFKMIGETIAIHAAKSWDERGWKFFDELGLTHYPKTREQYVAGAIVGIATIADVISRGDLFANGKLAPHQVRWFFGDYGWLIPVRTPLLKNIVCGGKQGLWTVDPLIETEIHEQLGSVN
jgi:hypothetical protein